LDEKKDARAKLGNNVYKGWEMGELARRGIGPER